MKDKKHATEEFEHWAVWEQDTYQTGSTCPPKSHRGLIAFLLVLVIFLCGIITALGMMNIRLFRQLAASGQKESLLGLSHAAQETRSDDFFALGFSGQNIPEFWHIYQNIPTGIYITEVAKNSDAAQKGIAPGDILLQVDGEPIPDTDTLHQLLTARQEQDAAQVLIYRSGKHLQLTIRLLPN
jgi:membrane-associated protease RseP (regulator of RpoE activity)